jgi:hypothetical protein
MALMEHKSIIAAVADGTPATCQCLFQGNVQRVSASLFQGSQLGGLRVAFFFLNEKRKKEKRTWPSMFDFALSVPLERSFCSFSMATFNFDDFKLSGAPPFH